MTYAERSAPVLPRSDAFRLPLCLAFVMSFLAFRPEYFDPKRKTLYSISRFHVKGCAFVCWGVMVDILPYLLSLDIPHGAVSGAHASTQLIIRVNFLWS